MEKEHINITMRTDVKKRLDTALELGLFPGYSDRSNFVDSAVDEKLKAVGA